MKNIYATNIVGLNAMLIHQLCIIFLASIEINTLKILSVLVFTCARENQRTTQHDQRKKKDKNFSRFARDELGP